MRQLSRRLGAIALLALLVRAIVPAGYMVASADTGNGRFLTVTVCSGHQNVVRVIDLDTGREVSPGEAPGGQTDDDSSSQPCVFGTAPHLATPVTFAEPERVHVIAAAPAALRPASLRPGRGIAAPPPPATGPPA